MPFANMNGCLICIGIGDPVKDADKIFLTAAIEKAKESVVKGGFPAGAVVVQDGAIVGSGISIGAQLCDPTSHGELSAIRDACKNLQKSDLSRATLYASMQPCVMCLGAAMWAGIDKIVYACSKEKVSVEYYGGHYDVRSIAGGFLRSLNIQQMESFEQDSLSIVKAWEDELSS